MIHLIKTGFLSENCYVYFRNQHALIIDPGDQAEDIYQWVDAKQLKVEAILLTHGHFDHIKAVDQLAAHYQCDVYLNPLDQPLIDYYNDTREGKKYQTTVETHLKNLLAFRSTNFDVKCFLAPGHSPGSTLILIDHQYLFSGDVLFKETIGRTDLMYSSPEDMNKTLAFIKTLNPNLKVYPGHGHATLLKHEFKMNPFLQN